MDWLIVAGVAALAGGIGGRAVRRANDAVLAKRYRPSAAQVEQTRSTHMLAGRCEVHAPGAIIDPGSGHAVAFRFLEVDEVRLRVALIGALPEDSGLAVHAVAAVQFNVEGRARMFIAPILHVAEAEGEDGGETYIDIPTPTHVADGETRGAFRVKISPDVPVEAVVLHGATDFSASVTDLSTTGVGLMFPEGAAPEVELGEEVELLLAIDGLEVQRTAIVRRMVDGACGLSLNASEGEEAAADECAYADLIRKLIDHEAGEDA